MNARTVALARLLGATRHDPLMFVEKLYSWGQPGALERFTGPRDWQTDILIELGEHLRGPKRFEPFRCSVASGHGIGKSALMAWIGQWGITTVSDAIGVITANTEGQLRTKTWPEMNRWLARSMLEPEFKLDGTVFRSTDPEHKNTWRLDAIPWSANNPEAFAGLHNLGRRIVLLFDEGSAIDDVIWETAEGALTDEDTEIIWVVFGNPTRPTGRFYLTHSLHSHRWINKKIDSRTVPGTNKAQLKAWVEDYGEDSDFVRVRVRGEFPRAAANQLIDTDSVRLAQEKDGEIAPRLDAPLIMGVDVAREGDDDSVVLFRKGRVAGVHGIHKFKKIRTTSLANRVASLIDEHGPHYVYIDGGGPGGPLCDMLLERGYPVIEVKFGSLADNADYANKRAEMWCRMRDWLLTHDVSIPWDDQDLFTQLIQQTYTYRESKNNDLILTAKARMKADGMASPDIADALALTFAFQVAPQVPLDAPTVASAAVARMDYATGWS